MNEDKDKDKKAFEYEFKYKIALEENKDKVKVSDLNEEAQTGIKEIAKITKTLNMLTAQNKKISPSTMKKIKALDKWVYFEILDHLHGTDENDDEIPVDPEEIEDELEEKLDEDEPTDPTSTDDPVDESTDDDPQDEPEPTDPVEPETVEVDQDGVFIDNELSVLFDQNRTEFTFDELRECAPKTYSFIWDGYEDNSENGVKTSYYSLIQPAGGDKFVLRKL